VSDLQPDQRPPVDVRCADGVATVTIDRAEKRNALSTEVIAALRAAVARVGADPAARVLVLRGAGDRAFSAGGDLTEMKNVTDTLGAHYGRGALAELFTDLWSLGKPTIARVAGHAVAGGLGLALACDFVLAADTASFRAPEVDAGLWGFMITVPMLRSMPPKLVLDMLLTGRKLSAEQAQRAGFVRDVVPLARLDDEVAELAGMLAAKPPATVRLGRDAFYRVLDQSAADALGTLHPLLTVILGGAEAAEGLAAFAEHRAPRWAAAGPAPTMAAPTKGEMG
jgi:enoyl-CoA hydratase/carnithine racemase